MKKQLVMRLRDAGLLLTLTWLASVLAHGQEVQPAQIPDLRLFSRTKPGVVQLRWTLETWPEQVFAFDLRRRIRKSDGKFGEWAFCNGLPIAPDLRPDKEWINLDRDPEIHEHLRNYLKRLLHDNDLQPMDAQATRNALSQDAEWLRSLCDLASRDWIKPLAAGFSFVDRDCPKPGEYEYGLFAVGPYGQPDVMPAAVCRVQVECIEPEWMRLFGETCDAGARLLWLPYGWREDINSFRVTKRERKADGTWGPEIQLLKETISPGMQMDRFDTWRLPVNMRDRLAREIRNYLEKDLFIDSALLRDFMRQGAYQNYVTQRKLLTQSLDYAMILGFGFIDTSYDQDAEYALYPVYADQAPCDYALSRCTVPKQPPHHPPFIELGAARVGSSIRVHWSMPEWNYLQLGCQGFHLYRVGPPESTSQPERVNQTPIPSAKSHFDLVRGQFIDERSALDAPMHYHLRLITVFNSELPPTPIDYTPAPPIQKLKLDAVRLLAVRHIPQGVHLQWEVDQPGVWLGFQVERSSKRKSDFSPVFSMLPADLRQFVDTDAPKVRARDYYRVTGISINGQRQTSKVLAVGEKATYSKPGK